LKKEKESGRIIIGIKFKKEAVLSWAEATRRNMDKAIAIVLDDKVISAPVVRSVIEGGNCQISGNFTEEDARYIVALWKQRGIAHQFCNC